MVAQRYNLNANQTFRRRRLFREPERVAGVGRFVLVVVEAAPVQEAGTATRSPSSESVVAERRDRGLRWVVGPLGRSRRREQSVGWTEVPTVCALAKAYVSAAAQDAEGSRSTRLG